jgi:alkane 1-monooxygenase
MWLRTWAAHLLAFWLPVTTLGFLATGPHGWRTSLAVFVVLAVSVVLDGRSRPVTRQPLPGLPEWPFDGVLYMLVVLQFVNVALFVFGTPPGGFWTLNALVGLILVGTNSGYSAIVVAHELVHRAREHMQLLGRALLCTVMYEHFYTEHLRGHHLRVGTDEDPATARFGETFERFWWRTLVGQFRSAWRLEARRLGDERMRWWDVRMLRSRVVHGLAAEWSLAALVLVAGGPSALLLLLLQAIWAVRLLEAVNYFEHWGLRREDRRVRPLDSWDTDRAFTLYSLVGLSRHADHHVAAARPYQQLRHRDESPKLPRGYYGTVVLVVLANRRFRALATDELARRRLGPFAAAGAQRT